MVGGLWERRRGGLLYIYAVRAHAYIGTLSASFRDGISFTHVTAESEDIEDIMTHTVGNYHAFLHSPCGFP